MSDNASTVLLVYYGHTMPELPEVETIRRGLSRLITGQKIHRISFDNRRSFPNDPNRVDLYLIGAVITAVDRRGKALLIRLNNGLTLAVHLKMTGQLVYEGPNVHFGAGHPTASLIGKMPDKSTRVIISFVSGTRLYFNDQRKFGWMKLLTNQELLREPFFMGLGPDPLRHSFTWQHFKQRLERHPRLGIKAALLNQSIIAGIGNIYADESLWSARIHPARPAGSLSDAECRNLIAAIKEVLLISLDKGGSTDRNYVDAEGHTGSYLEFARVFRRQNQACLRCRTPIRKVKLAGRGTHYCPHCQVLKV